MKSVEVKKMMVLLVVVTLWGVVGAATARADLIVNVSDSFDRTAVDGFNQTLTVDKADRSIGTLTSVEVTLNGSWWVGPYSSWKGHRQDSAYPETEKKAQSCRFASLHALP